MVAEATQVSVSVICTIRFLASVLGVFLKEKWGIIKNTFGQQLKHGLTDKNMVDTLPQTLIFVSTPRAIGTFRP